MKHLSTSYWQFINEANKTAVKPHAIDTEKIEALRQQLKSLQNKLSTEKDPTVRKKLTMKIKVCELRIMIAQIP